DFTVDAGTCVPARSDEFDGSSLDTNRWTTVRTPAGLEVEVKDGKLVVPVAQGDIHQANQGPISFVGQPVPEGDGDWEIETLVDISHTSHWQHAGLKIWADDD